MRLVVDYDLKELKVWAFKRCRGGVSVSSFAKDVDEMRDDKSLKRFFRAACGPEEVEGISVRVLFGGDRFDRPAPVDAEFFARFEELTDLFPFYVPSMLEMLGRIRKAFEGTAITAFFETSFFTQLPDEEKYYALPLELHRNDRIQKWGFHGLYHEANARMLPRDSRTISIVFDKQTTVCAIRGHKPLAISLGYTPLEGVMSRTGCGDLDPGIAFYLMNVHGYTIHRINHMLKEESGFVGLTGYDLPVAEMLKLRGKDARVDLAFAVYRNQIIKHIGDGISVLGGLDRIVIGGGSADAFTPVIYDILRRLTFLGINAARLPWDGSGETGVITSAESKIQVRLNRLDLPHVIYRAGPR